MSDPALVKKLQIRSGNQEGIINAPPGFLEAFSPLPDGASVQETPTGKDKQLVAWLRRAYKEVGR